MSPHDFLYFKHCTKHSVPYSYRISKIRFRMCSAHALCSRSFLKKFDVQIVTLYCFVSMPNALTFASAQSRVKPLLSAVLGRCRKGCRATCERFTFLDGSIDLDTGYPTIMGLSANSVCIHCMFGWWSRPDLDQIWQWMW